MRDSGLDRVLRACETGLPAPEWLASVERLRQERRRVLRHLESSSELFVYGFTSSLGELDSALDNPGESQLLRAHLVGPTSEAPAGLLRAMSACKLEQLHRGGTGIPPELVTMIVDSLAADLSDVRGAWTASYGAGDVVPAAWWAAGAVIRGRAIDHLKGATISMINGSFVGAAHAVVLRARWDALAERLRELVERGARTAASVERGQHGIRGTGAQLAISQRDPSPVLDELRAGAEAIERAVEARLQVRSGNPLFELDGDDVIARSQNSYLDFGLTGGIRRWMQSVVVSASWAHRLAALENERLLRTGNLSPGAVQQPKVANALLLDIKRHAAGVPLDFVSYDSSGIEDARDLAVAHCAAGHAMLDALASFLDVLEDSAV
jgi:hypothetical protein